MAQNKTLRRLEFTIYHGLGVSFALHTGLALPLVLHGLAPPSEDLPALVVQLQGVVADSQAEQMAQQQTKGSISKDEVDQPKPPDIVASDDQRMEAKDDEDAAASPPVQAEPSPPSQPQSGGTDSDNSIGAEERQNAQTIKRDRNSEIDRLKDYVKRLTKKVQANLVYPAEARQSGLQGAATVGFTILQSGQILPETLKIITSSGQPKLDASALKTIRSSAPFDVPPKKMNVTIAVAFGRKH